MNCPLNSRAWKPCLILLRQANMIFHIQQRSTIRFLLIHPKWFQGCSCWSIDACKYDCTSRMSLFIASPPIRCYFCRKPCKWRWVCACRRYWGEAEPKPVAGQERGGKVSHYFFHQFLTVKLTNTSISLIVAENKKFLYALIWGLGSLHISDLKSLKFYCEISFELSESIVSFKCNRDDF